MFENFPTPVLFAHRGASAHAPENTLPAFELALQQGDPGVHLYAKLTSAGLVILFHHPPVDLTTHGHGRVRDLSLADFRKLDAGAWYAESYRGTKVPTLDEVFEAIGKRCVINVELTNYATPRDALVEKVCALVERHALQDRILFSSFFAGNLKKAAALLPSVPRGLLALDGWKGAWARSFGFMFGDYQAMHPYITDVNAPQVSRVHQIKRRIHVWTANSVEEVTRLKNWGVDGIFTDNPQTAVRALGRGQG
jgi:glycerophosphoryl diester phosphodiesterase